MPYPRLPSCICRVIHIIPHSIACSPCVGPPRNWIKEQSGPQWWKKDLFPETYAPFGQASLLLVPLFLLHILAVVYLTCCVSACAWKHIPSQWDENFQYVNTGGTIQVSFTHFWIRVKYKWKKINAENQCSFWLEMNMRSHWQGLGVEISSKLFLCPWKHRQNPIKEKLQ